MMFVIGIVLFALAILISVALHECGHMWVARATGMKVRRYFVGFGALVVAFVGPWGSYFILAIPYAGLAGWLVITAGRQAREEAEAKRRAAGETPTTSADAPPLVIGHLFAASAFTSTVDWLYSGIPLRFPDIRICMSEGGIGWVAALMDRCRKPVLIRW